MSDVAYAKPIRVFHSIFAFCMLTQLAVGTLMDVPEVEGEHEASTWITSAFAHEAEHGMGSVEETLGFQVHEILGLVIGGLLVLRLLLAMTSLPGANWRKLFPWLFADGRQALKDEVQSQLSSWMKFKLAAPEDGEVVARSVHGFILLFSLVMAATGLQLYLGWSTTAPQTMWIELVAEVHEAAVTVLEALLVAHVLAVILHQMQGHNILARIKP